MLSLWIGLQVALAQQGTFIVEERNGRRTMNQYMIQPGDTLWDLGKLVTLEIHNALSVMVN